MVRPVLVALALLGVAAPTGAGEPVWKYVADDQCRPVPRAVALAPERPPDLREAVVYRGKTQQYAQVRYGSADSARVAVVVDQVSSDDWDLYVDADRNRVIEAKDKVGGSGRGRTGRLDVEITRGLEVVHEPRTVRWQLGLGGKSLRLATVGYVAGTVEIAGKHVAARRVDGDANGLFADAGDRLWLDLDGDGQFDPITEQFPLLPVLTIAGQRYAVRGDAAGSKLTVERLTAEGRIRLRLGTLEKDVAVVALHVMLVAEDGTAFVLTGADRAVVVPAGKYAFGAVSLSVRQPGDSLPVHFVFSRTGVDGSVPWHELQKDQELVLDPIGQLRFALDVDRRDLTPRAGAEMRVQPQLFTADGLLINSCTSGEADQTSRYDVGRASSLTLYDAQHRLLDTQKSGFA